MSVVGAFRSLGMVTLPATDFLMQMLNYGVDSGVAAGAAYLS
jgi:hypothetical protein